jgi:hypothetical protein
MPVTRGLRIWFWIGLFPAFFFAALMFVYWAAVLGFLLTLGIVVGCAVVVVAIVRRSHA